MVRVYQNTTQEHEDTTWKFRFLVELLIYRREIVDDVYNKN